jgi:hypothetical protein
LNSHILYIADKTIVEAPIIPITGDFWNIPAKDKNSPAQFKDKGTAALKSVKHKNRIVNTGIFKAIPL